MREHGTLWYSGGSGGVDDGGKFVGLGQSGAGIESRVSLLRSIEHETLHVKSMSGFNRIHDYGFFNGRLLPHGADL